MLSREEYERIVKVFLVELNHLCAEASETDLRALARFHPEIDGYLTYGSWGEDERIFHGQRWIVCPVPLALDPRTPAPAEVAALRARFPEKVLLGTLAREEKISSPPFLEAVAEILREIWQG